MMRDIVYLIATIFLLFVITSSVINLQDSSILKSPTVTFNASAVYTKNILQEFVNKEHDKIIKNTVDNITYMILHEASKGRRTYTWKNTHVVVDHIVYEKIIDKLINLFPDIHMEEYDGFSIKFDWT
jgi:hypothetical protein